MGDCQQRIEIEMQLKMPRERIERRIDPRLVLERRIARTAEAREQSPPKCIAREEPVQMTAGNAPIARDRAIPAAIEPQHRTLGIGTGRATQMHLVTFDRRTARRLDAL